MNFKSIMKKGIVGILCASMVMSLAGCSEKIFKKPVDKYELTGVNADEMQQGVFYVKNGTKFYKVYFPAATFNSGSVTKISTPQRLFWLGRDESLIPTYYKGELIAYSSYDSNIGAITLERFKDVGYSFGMIKGTYDAQGEYLEFTTNTLVAGSDAASKLSKAKAKDIRVVSIDNVPVTEAHLDKAGIIHDLQFGRSYEVSYYSGTHYNTETIKCDANYFEGFETYQIKDVALTKNGFIAIEMPDDAKSGWYMINGQGLFKYYAYEKGSTDIANADMNEAYYSSEQEQIEEYSQQYLISIPKKTEGIAITLTYDSTQYEDEEIVVKLTAPDGTIYDLTGTAGTMECMLQEAMAGKWTINVYPRDLEVRDIKVSSTDPTQDAMSDTFSYSFEEPQTNILFYANYEGSDEVWGYVTDELGTTTEMTLNERNKRLTCNFAYLPEGKYTITVYHYADTSVSDAAWGENVDNEITEIITVTE